MEVKTTKLDIECSATGDRTFRTLTLPRNIQEASNMVLERLHEFSTNLAETEEQTRLAALFQVSQTLGNTLNLDEVLNQVMDAVIALTGAERGFLMLINPDTGDWICQSARNFEQETLQREDMEVSRTVINTTVESGKGVLTTNAQTDPRFSAQESVISFASTVDHVRPAAVSPQGNRCNLCRQSYPYRPVHGSRTSNS